MHKRKGWDPFWAALLASLLVLVPLVGGTVLLSHRQLRTQLRQAARSESGIPVQLPKTTDRLTVLLCVSGEQPGFLLAYAGQNAFHLLSIPAELTVSFAGEAAPLTRCYTAAGPARCREALAQVLSLPEDTRYLALSPAVLERLAGRFGLIRVGFTGALTEEELARHGGSRAVQGISAGDAHSFLCQLQTDPALPPEHCAAARGAVWDAFFRQNLDLLGIIVLGVTTAVGGGMMRDILLGIVPPSLFTNPVYTIMAFVTVLILFTVIRMNQHFLEGDCIITYEKLMNIFDAIGLAAFTVTGIDTAVMAGYGNYHFLSVFLGVLTGVGGGLLRDIMARQTPYILKKHVYACASIAGGMCYSFLLSSPVNNDAAMIISAVLVVAIRLLATHYCWNLPRALKKS